MIFFSFYLAIWENYIPLFKFFVYKQAVINYFNGQNSDFWSSQCNLANAYFTVATQAVLNPSLNMTITQQGLEFC